MQITFPHPLILGHRGAPLDAPENTLASFALATSAGADGVELDVQLASDGTPVIIHDPSLDRTFSARGEIAKLAWPALERLTGARLPSLQQAAAWAAGAGAWLNVEIKATGAEAASIEVLRASGGLDRIIFSSFDPASVSAVARLAPDARRFLLLDAWDGEAAEVVAKRGAQGVCLRDDAASAVTLEVIRNEDLPVIVWSVDDRPRMVELLRAGVAGLITNRPAAGVAARAEVVG